MATPDNAPVPQPSRPRWPLWLVVAGCLLLLAGGAWWWYHPWGPQPPELPLSDFEPEVAALLDEARQGVLSEPRSDKAWGRLGQALLVNGAEREAEPCLAEAERLAPQEPRWPYLRGACLRDSDTEAAIRHFRRAIGLATGPRSRPGLRFLLADALLSEGRLDEAEEELDALQREPPNRPRLGLMRGVLAARRGDWRACRDHLGPLTKLPTTRRQATLLLAAAHRQLGNASLAEDLARQAQGLAPDVAWDDPYVKECLHLARNRLARLDGVNALRGHVSPQDEVQALLRLIEETEGKDDRVYALLAERLAGSGQLGMAEKAARSGMAVRPEGRANLFVLCTVLLSRAEHRRQTSGAHDEEGLKSLREAEALAGRVLKRNPNDAWMLIFRGRARCGLGRAEEGLADLRAAVVCRPDLTATHHDLGLALLNAGRLAEARAALARARSLSPGPDKHIDEAMRRLAEAEKKARGH